jgi:hypothetical protein
MAQQFKGWHDQLSAEASRWVRLLDAEDLAFLKRFVLASGSQKELARTYGVSYPTIRLRLTRLIEKVRVLDSQEITTEFERVLRAQFAEGKFDMSTLMALLAAHRAELEAHHEATDRPA